MYCDKPESHGKGSSPLTGRGVVTGAVKLVKHGDFWHHRVIGVRGAHKRAYRQQHLCDGERRRPLVFEDVEADSAVSADVAMVNSGRKSHLGGLEGVVWREVNIEEEHTIVVGRVIGSNDRGLPMELLFLVNGAC